MLKYNNEDCLKIEKIKLLFDFDSKLFEGCDKHFLSIKMYRFQLENGKNQKG